MNFLVTIFAMLILCTCSPSDQQQSTGTLTIRAKDSIISDTPTLSTSPETIKLHLLRKLFVVGDFDGNQTPDTLYQHVYSKRTHKEIDSAADPFQNDWDTVVNWFYNQEAEVYLSIKGAHRDTLRLGIGRGVYCLINIGDNNGDNKDEIALVIDYIDYSRVNTCSIYSLCNDKWTLIKYFNIHEDAFNYTNSEEPQFKEIKGYLEFKDKNWFYLDYDQVIFRPEEDGKMKRLKTKQCR